MVNNGVVSNFTFSVFLKPITEELGWSRATIASAMFLTGVVAAFVTGHFGWRLTYVGVGITVLIFALPMAYLFLGKPDRSTAERANHASQRCYSDPGRGKIVKRRFQGKPGSKSAS
jgi:hypothetical protein